MTPVQAAVTVHTKVSAPHLSHALWLHSPFLWHVNWAETVSPAVDKAGTPSGEVWDRNTFRREGGLIEWHVQIAKGDKGTEWKKTHKEGDKDWEGRIN